MLILLNFGQNGVNWYAAPLAMLILLNGNLVLQLLEFALQRFFAVNPLRLGFLRHSTQCL